MSFHGDVLQGWWTGPNSQRFAQTRRTDTTIGWDPGNMIVARLVVLDYIAREGETEWDPSTLSMPAGWEVLTWQTVVRIPGHGRYLPVVHVWVGIQSVTEATARAVPEFTTSSPGFLSPAEAGALASLRPFWSTTLAERPLLWRLRGHAGVDDIVWLEDGSKFTHSAPIPAGSGGTMLATIEDPDVLTRVPPAKGSAYDVKERWSGLAYRTEGAQYGDGGPGIINNPVLTPWEWTRYTTLYESSLATVQVLPRRAVMATLRVGNTNRPLRPAITSHRSPSYIAGGRGWTLRWRYAPGFAGQQSGFRVTRVSAGVTEYWTGTEWSSSTTTVTSTDRHVYLPGAGFPSGWSGTLRVATVGSDTAAASLDSEAVQVHATELPTPTLTIGGITEGIVADMTPDVILGATTVSNIFPLRWEARLTDLTSGDVLAHETGSELGPWSHGVVAQDGTWLRADLRIQVTGGEWTDWASATFVIDVTPPEAPAVSTSATTHATSGVEGVSIRSTWTPVEGGFDWLRVPTRVRIERLDGEGWQLAGLIDAPVGVTDVEGVDWYAPTGAPVRYRVRAEAVLSDGAVLRGEWGEAAGTFTLTSRSWLVPYGRPDLAVQIREFRRDPRGRASGGVSYDVLDDEFPRVTSSTQWHRKTGGGVRPWSQDEVAATMATLMSGLPILKRGCRSRSLHDGTLRQDPDQWLRVVDDVEESMFWQGPTQAREVSFSWVPQRAPWEVDL